ncbi:hypothetical protein GCM10020331_019730 [Ectobacillus funiculus]
MGGLLRISHRLIWKQESLFYAKKARAEGLDIPNEVMLYIANQIDSNIRELEGALIRVVAYSSLINKDMNADLAAEALKHIIPNAKPRIISIHEIQKGSRTIISSEIRRF